MYFPVEAPFRRKFAMHSLGADFGMGDLDNLVFQFDDNLERYTAEKARILDSHYAEHSSGRATLSQGFKLWEAVIEQKFGHLSASDLDFFTDGNEVLDFISRKIQEDIAITVDGVVEYANICFPNHFRPADIIGQGIGAIHGNIPCMDKINAAMGMIVARVCKSGNPQVQFNWGLSATPDLNQHPDAGNFRDYSDSAFFRVERQVLYPLDECSLLFTVKAYMTDVSELGSDRIDTLVASIESMGDSTRDYKGITSRAVEILLSYS